MSDDQERTVEVSGQEVRVSNPEKVYFPALGATKSELVDYYLSIGDALLNTAGGRPALLQRFPHGATGKSFFQKRVPDNAPEWLQTAIVTQRHHIERTGGGRRGPRHLGRQSRVPRTAPLALRGR